MKLSAILAPLIAAGVSGEVILATVKAFEEQQSDAIERRRESDRVRQQRRRHVTSRDVTVTERDKDTSSPCPLVPPSQTLPPIIPQSSSPETSLRSERRAAKATAREQLQVVLDADHADAVIQHRQRIRKPLTDHAAKLLAGKFARCPDANAAADAMIANGWQGFEPEWLSNRAGRSTGPPRHERTMDDVIDDFIERHSHEPTAGTTIDHDVGDHPANVHRLAAPQRRGF